MGQAGSTQLAPAPRGYHRALSGAGGVTASATLPHEPLRHAPKVLPSLETSPRLRCTDNGAILHSGGTISGRRALSASASATLPAAAAHARHAHLTRTNNQHAGVYRSRSASSGEQSPPAAVTSTATAAAAGRLTRERDPLHRSHTHLDLLNPLEPATSKRFGSEPDLRNEEEQTKQRCNKHFRKKYKAPPPPSHQHDERDNSSPDPYGSNNRKAPPRKLRLFKTRSETKKLSDQTTEMKYSHNVRQPLHNGVVNSTSENQSLERQYKPECKEKDQFIKYPDSRDRDMIQSSSSLRIEEHLLQASNQKNDYRRRKNDKSNAYRSKANKNQDNTDARKTPHLDRTFRYSERFSKKAETDPPVLRREKSFDATLVAREREELGTCENENLNRIKVIEDQLKSSRLIALAPKEKQVRKSLPSLLAINSEEKDEFKTELKMATKRIRTGSNVNSAGDTRKPVQESKPSQNDRNCNNKCSRNNHPNTKKSIPIQNIKVKESSPRNCTVSVLRQESSASKSYNNDERYPMRNNQTEAKKLNEKQNALNKKLNKDVNVKRQGASGSCARESRSFADRGQASGKESTPEQSPNRLKEIEKFKERENTTPSKQFYFGMIESKEVDINENIKDFPGLGSPIIEEFSNFHIIERKLLGYHDKEVETDKFVTRLPSNDNNVKNVSSESALSSSEEDGSAGSAESRGIALHLRPTLPKKQLEIPRFSPAAAWRQLAQIETEPDMHQVLAVDIKTPIAVESPAESPHRSDKSGDKSGDSGISGDHAHSDQRLESPPRPRVTCGAGATEASAWTPQQDLEGDSGSDGAGGAGAGEARGEGLVTYSARGQPFSLSLPRDRQPHDKNKQFQQPFNSLQKLKKSVSGALGAALGSRRFDLEHEPILDEPSEQNWFLSKSAPNSLTNPFLYAHNPRPKGNHEGDIKEEPTPPNSDQEDGGVGVRTWSGGAGGGGGSGRNASYLSWGGHVMYLPPAPAQATAHGAPQHTAQPLSLLLTSTHPQRPTRSKSSGEIELRSRAARAARELKGEMRERERSASPSTHSHPHLPPPNHTSSLARALPARVVAATTSPNARGTSSGGGTGSGGARTKAKRFTFQSTVRQLERRRIAEKLSREADLKEQQRRTELEAMRRVEEEFQRKRAREKANIRQQLRLVSGAAAGATSLPPLPHHKQARDDPDGAVSPRDSPAPESTGGGGGGSGRGGEGRIKNRERRDDDREPRHSNASSEISGRSKSTTPVRCVELSEWREGPGGGGGAARQYRDWGAPPGTQIAHNIAHPPACYRMPKSPAPVYLNANGKEAVDTFSGSPRSDNYRLEFARGVPRSPRTPRAPRHPLASRTSLVPHSPSSSSSELSTSVGGAGRQAIRLRW